MSDVHSQSAGGLEGDVDNDLKQTRALAGRKLADRFEVGRLIGYGGSSLIFEGWHVVLRHPVAVKVLRADLAVKPELVNHFALEAMVTAQMRSPHVVRVFDTGLIDDTVPYTVLELLRGQTLSELRHAGRTFTPEEAIDLVLQACLALDESHSHGIVHRDIKPDNLFLAELPDGAHCLKVIDFGVAKHVGSHTFLSDAWVGTPGYMAPEQISSPGHVDERADIWALGVVLFELLTGRSPFRGTNREELLSSTVRDEPLPLDVTCQRLPVELYETVRRCLSKEPSTRFRHVQELAAALRRVRTQMTTGAEAATGIVRLPDNWEARLTPSHGWALPDQTVVLAAPKVRSLPRKRIGVGLAAAAAAALVLVIAHDQMSGASVEANASGAVASSDTMRAVGEQLRAGQGPEEPARAYAVTTHSDFVAKPTDLGPASLSAANEREPSPTSAVGMSAANATPQLQPSSPKAGNSTTLLASGSASTSSTSPPIGPSIPAGGGNHKPGPVAEPNNLTHAAPGTAPPAASQNGDNVPDVALTGHRPNTARASADELLTPWTESRR
jgi:serine/threonine protein kinase